MSYPLISYQHTHCLSHNQVLKYRGSLEEQTKMSEDTDKQLIPLSDADEWGGITGLRPLILTEVGLVATLPIERLQFRNPLETSPWIDGPM